ncbi:MAG: hypothetical protein HQL29_00125 [Candidatus Omnitrophica bacterium]|nr:hypothetical protein [Candidatus Omnitrophota bacterium]
MAYVFGLIATDGCLSENGRIALCLNDKDLLLQVKAALGSDHPVKKANYQNGLYVFHFAREKHVKGLEKTWYMAK